MLTVPQQLLPRNPARCDGQRDRPTLNACQVQRKATLPTHQRVRRKNAVLALRALVIFDNHSAIGAKP